MKKQLLSLFLTASAGLILVNVSACGKDKKPESGATVTSPSPITVKPAQEHRTTKEDYVKALDKRIDQADTKLSGERPVIEELSLDRDELNEQSDKIFASRQKISEKRNTLAVAAANEWPKLADQLDESLSAYEQSVTLLAEKIKFSKTVEEKQIAIEEDIEKLAGTDNFKAKTEQLKNELSTLDNERANALKLASTTEWKAQQEAIEKKISALKGKAKGSIERAEWQQKYQEWSNQLDQQREALTAKVNDAKDNTKDILQKRLEALKAEQQELNDAFVAKVDASDEEWEKFKSGFKDSSEKLEKKISNFAAELTERFKALKGD